MDHLCGVRERKAIDGLLGIGPHKMVALFSHLGTTGGLVILGEI